MQLRNELRDKEMKLTDIRLEALSSAHQLDQLREAMNRMQVGKKLQRSLGCSAVFCNGKQLHTKIQTSNLKVEILLSMYLLISLHQGKAFKSQMLKLPLLVNKMCTWKMQ